MFSSGSGDSEGNEVREASPDGSCLWPCPEGRFFGPRNVLTFLLSLDALDACDEDRRDKVLFESECIDTAAAVLDSMLFVMSMSSPCDHDADGTKNQSA